MYTANRGNGRGTGGGPSLPMLAQLVSTDARRAEQIEPDRDGDASCYLHEAAALITTTPGNA